MKVHTLRKIIKPTKRYLSMKHTSSDWGASTVRDWWNKGTMAMRIAFSISIELTMYLGNDKTYDYRSRQKARLWSNTMHYWLEYVWSYKNEIKNLNNFVSHWSKMNRKNTHSELLSTFECLYLESTGRVRTVRNKFCKSQVISVTLCKTIAGATTGMVVYFPGKMG